MILQKLAGISILLHYKSVCSPGSHIGDPFLSHSAISNSLGQVLAKAASAWHNQVETSIGTVKIVDGIPVEQHEALEVELALEDAVEHLAVVAPVGAVDALVRAHDGRNAGMHAVGEGPEVELVHGPVVDIGGDGLYAEVGATEGFLLVCNQVLHGQSNILRLIDSFPYLDIGDDTSILVGNDGVGIELAGQIRVNTETFPVASTERTAAERSSIRSQDHVNYRLVSGMLD